MELEERNKRVVTHLYKALSSGDTHTLQRLLAPDLEWWFHGPPSHRHHLVPLLTSHSLSHDVVLLPDLVVGFGSVVIAEGYDAANLLWWVHAWTLTDRDGLITQVREYLNTSLTVTRLGTPSETVSSSSPLASSVCQSIWHSKLCDQSDVPGLILAV